MKDTRRKQARVMRVEAAVAMAAAPGVRDHGDLPPDQKADGIHNFGPCDSECHDLQYSPHEQ